MTPQTIIKRLMCKAESLFRCEFLARDTQVYIDSRYIITLKAYRNGKLIRSDIKPLRKAIHNHLGKDTLVTGLTIQELPGRIQIITKQE